MAKVRMKALAFGTFTGVGGSIYHFNPESSDEGAKFPIVEEEDVAQAKQRELGEELDGTAAAKLNREAGSTDLNDIWAELQAKQLAQANDIENDLGIPETPGAAPSALGGQAVTAYPAGDKAHTGREAFNPDAAPGAPVATVTSNATAPGGEGSGEGAGEGEGGKEPSILDQSVEKLTADLASIDDVDQLKALRAQEESGKTRATALAAIDARIGALEA